MLLISEVIEIPVGAIAFMILVWVTFACMVKGIWDAISHDETPPHIKEMFKQADLGNYDYDYRDYYKRDSDELDKE